MEYAPTSEQRWPRPYGVDARYRAAAAFWKRTIEPLDAAEMRLPYLGDEARELRRVRRILIENA